MDYYGQEDMRAQYYRNMGLGPDGVTPLGPPSPVPVPASLPATPEYQPRMGGNSLGSMGDPGVYRPQPKSASLTFQAQQSASPSENSYGRMHPSQSPARRPLGPSASMGGNPQNTRPRQPNPAMPPPGQPMRGPRKSTPMGA